MNTSDHVPCATAAAELSVNSSLTRTRHTTGSTMTMSAGGAVLAVLCLLNGAAHRVMAQAPGINEREAARVDVIRRIAPSVVCVMSPDGNGGGSGVLISPDGYAISNYHVTSGAGNFMKCGLNDGQLYDAVLVGIDPTGDIALIRLTGRHDFPFAEPGDSDQVQAGDEVLALGNPFLLAADFTPTVTYGIVSGVHRYQYPAGTFLEYTDCIQIDASINPGNSGGPLFDIQGRWIGINGRASFEKRGRVNVGAAYAISVRQIQLFLEQLRSGLIVDHGVTEFTVETLSSGRTVVSRVSETSEAWRRGLRPQHELVSFAGRAISSANDYQNVLGIFPEGSRVPLTWRDRDGVHAATIRLRPLHAYLKAPPLPEERQPERGTPPDDPERPNPRPAPGIPGAAESPPAPEFPEALRQQFEERDGFANYFFNRQQQQRLLEPLRKWKQRDDRVPTWVLSVSAGIEGRPLDGELVVGQAGAGLTLGTRVWFQPADAPSVDAEPPMYPGLLTAVSQWHALMNSGGGGFDETIARGALRHLPTGRDVAVLLTRNGVVTTRWGFVEEQDLPYSADVEYSVGVDEARIVMTDWNLSGPVPFPGSIGFVDPATEALQMITIRSCQTREAGQ